MTVRRWITFWRRAQLLLNSALPGYGRQTVLNASGDPVSDIEAELLLDAIR